MSVRKRLWFTSAHIRQRAERMAVAAGKHTDSWKVFHDAAQAEAGALLRSLRDMDSAATNTALKDVAPKDRPRQAWVVYLGKGQDRTQETFDLKEEADEQERKMRSKGARSPINKKMTVAEAAEAWITRVENNGMRGRGRAEKSTTRQYRQHVNLHIVPRVGKSKIAKLTKADAEKFQNSLLNGDGAHKALSRELARKVWTSFKSILKTQQHAHVLEDVSISKEDRGSRALEKGRDFPTPEEIERLIRAAKAAAETKVASDLKRYALLLTACTTGLRASELRGLHWKDIDLDGCELSVRLRADRWNKLGSPKSKSSRRTVPFDPIARKVLLEWKAKSAFKNDDDLVFSTKTGAVEHHANMLRSLGPVMKAAGVVKNGKPKYALHAFRHFFASWCINPVSRKGRNIRDKVVQQWLGHSSITMTYDQYGHLFPDSGADRAELTASVRTLLG